MSLHLRIFASAKPSAVGMPVVAMSKEDAEFWRLRRERDLQRAAEVAR